MRQLVVRGMMVAAFTAAVVACGESSSGLAESAVGSSSSESTTTVEPTATTGPTSSSTSSTTTSTVATSITVAKTTTTNAPVTTTTTGASTTSTTRPPAGLPTPEDVALQYDSLCLQTDSRDLVEKWFEPGVLDDLRCQQGGDDQSAGVVAFTACEPIVDGAGEASHSCFFYYEGGGYSILVGDLGRGYRGLAATFVVD